MTFYILYMAFILAYFPTIILQSIWHLFWHSIWHHSVWHSISFSLACVRVQACPLRLELGTWLTTRETHSHDELQEEQRRRSRSRRIGGRRRREGGVARRWGNINDNLWHIPIFCHTILPVPNFPNVVLKPLRKTVPWRNPNRCTAPAIPQQG